MNKIIIIYSLLSFQRASHGPHAFGTASRVVLELELIIILLETTLDCRVATCNNNNRTGQSLEPWTPLLGDNRHNHKATELQRHSEQDKYTDWETQFSIEKIEENAWWDGFLGQRTMVVLASDTSLWRKTTATTRPTDLMNLFEITFQKKYWSLRGLLVKVPD